MHFQQKVALLSVQCLAFSILAVATVGNCNVGTILCCSSVGPPTPEDIELWSLLGIPPLQGLIGTGCNPFSATGPGSIGGVSVETCATPPVCCTSYISAGFMASGCDYVNF